MKMVAFVLAGAFTGLAARLYYMDAIIVTPPAAFRRASTIGPAGSCHQQTLAPKKGRGEDASTR